MYFHLCFFFFTDTSTTEIYTYVHTLSRPDALPISALLGLAVAVDDEHVRAGLIDDDCRLRDHQRLLRLCPLDDHADELTGDEQPLRIGQGRAEDHRVGRRIDLDIDEVDRPGLAVDRAVRQAELHPDGARVLPAGFGGSAQREQLA